MDGRGGTRGWSQAARLTTDDSVDEAEKRAPPTAAMIGRAQLRHARREHQCALEGERPEKACILPFRVRKMRNGTRQREAGEIGASARGP